jgi:hypothetical protein
MIKDTTKSGWILVDPRVDGPIGIDQKGHVVVNCLDPKRIALFATRDRAVEFASIEEQPYEPRMADLVLVYR